jgi:two-component system phosphate regulon response regulator PhoB
VSAKILVVEDEPAIQELIATHLKHAGHIPWPAHDAETAMELIRGSLPDLVLLDWMLPGMSGVSFTKVLRQEARTRGIPIIMLTARGAEQDKVLGLESGVDDFVTKPFSPRELLSRIKAVLRRRAPEATDDLVCVGALHLDPNSRRVTVNGDAIKLGPTEFRLLHFMMTHPERVYSRAQLLDHVWGDHVFVDERTVDVHIRRVRRVLEPSGLDRIIETVRGSGYRMNAA